MNDAAVVLQAQGLCKHYQDGTSRIDVLQGVELALCAGETLAIVGASGSGKSTLLNLLGGLDQPSAGQVTVCGQGLAGLNEAGRGRLRNQQMGFVYQFHHLLPEFTALENVAMPLLIGRAEPARAAARARETLEQVGLGHRLEHKPATLSGGERQRVAIARALVTRPALVLADEPTGNLDERTALQVQDMMLALAASGRTGFLIVTHDLRFAARCQRRLELHDGQLRPLPA